MSSRTDPKNCPKIVQKLYFLGSVFWTSFRRSGDPDLELKMVPKSAKKPKKMVPQMGPLSDGIWEPTSGGLGPQNAVNYNGKSIFSRAARGGKWTRKPPKMIPRTVPKFGKNGVQILFKNQAPKSGILELVWGVVLGPKTGSKGFQRLLPFGTPFWESQRLSGADFFLG